MPRKGSLKVITAAMMIAAPAFTLDLAASQAFGQSTPQEGIPQLWTPPSISTEDHESTPTFTPDGRWMFYVLSDKNFAKSRIMQSRCDKGGWGSPTLAPFAKPLPVVESDPFITYDGKRFFFISTRDSSADPAKRNFDIFTVDRLRDGSWGEPRRLPEPVNSSGSEFLPRMDRNGDLYFRSDRPGGLGSGDIYLGRQDKSGRWTVQNMGAPINTAGNEVEASISQDGRTMIVTAERPEPAHLFRYRWRSGRWVKIGQIMAKADVYQVGPLISPKGDRLLFAQQDGHRSGEIFLTDLTPHPDTSWPPKCR